MPYVGTFVCCECGDEEEIHYPIPAEIADGLLCNQCAAKAQAEYEANQGGFKEQVGRDPIPGKDYDPDGDFCQDDYEYFTSTGRYAPKA